MGKKLESVQNKTSELIFHCDNSTLTTIMLREVRWAPIRMRRHLKNHFDVKKFLSAADAFSFAKSIFQEETVIVELFQTIAYLKLSLKSSNNHFGERCFWVARNLYPYLTRFSVRGTLRLPTNIQGIFELFP